MLGDMFTFTKLPKLRSGRVGCLACHLRQPATASQAKTSFLESTSLADPSPEPLRSQPSRELPCWRLQPFRGQLVLAAGGTKNTNAPCVSQGLVFKQKTPSRNPAKLLTLGNQEQERSALTSIAFHEAGLGTNTRHSCSNTNTKTRTSTRVRAGRAVD